MPRTSRFLISMSLVLGVAVVGSQVAVAAPRAPAPGHPVTVTASVPEKASLSHSFSIDVAVSGPIAGLQAQVMLDQKAAEVGGVMPSARGSKGLNPVMNHGGARIGAYGAKAFSGGKFLRIAIFPRKAGRLSIHLGRIAAVTESGRRVQIRLARSDFSVQIGTSKRVFRAATVTAALPGRIARGHIQADSDRNGIVTRQDLFNVTYGWSAGNGDGDVDHNGRVDVSDLQTVLSLVKPEPKVLRTAATLPLTFVVNTGTDAPDATPGDRICASAAGLCTLRAAIDEGNRHSGPDTVAFALPGHGSPGDPALARKDRHQRHRAHHRRLHAAWRGAEHRPDQRQRASGRRDPGQRRRFQGSALHHNHRHDDSRPRPQPDVEDHLDVDRRLEHDHRRQLHRHERHGREHRLQRCRRRADGRRLRTTT